MLYVDFTSKVERLVFLLAYYWSTCLNGHVSTDRKKRAQQFDLKHLAMDQQWPDKDSSGSTSTDQAYERARDQSSLCAISILKRSSFLFCLIHTSLDALDILISILHFSSLLLPARRLSSISGGFWSFFIKRALYQLAILHDRLHLEVLLGRSDYSRRQFDSKIHHGLSQLFWRIKESASSRVTRTRSSTFAKKQGGRRSIQCKKVTIISQVIFGSRL